MRNVNASYLKRETIPAVKTVRDLLKVVCCNMRALFNAQWSYQLNARTLVTKKLHTRSARINM